MPTYLSPEELERHLALRDLTDPAAGEHAVQLLIDLAVSSLKATWPSIDVRLSRGPRIVPTEDNYDGLLVSPEAASRDARYTRYVDESNMLRSHSSAMVPPSLRHLAAARKRPKSPEKPEKPESPERPERPVDVLLVCPGIVYRRDSIDWQHTGTPHQLDLWRICSHSQMQLTDLDDMIESLVQALVPGRPERRLRRVHSYTLKGCQVDVKDGDTWVEILECGLAKPEVLEKAGLSGWSGLALGMGLDRLLMLRKGIPDIRLLRSDDPRVTEQMRDLSKYVPVSAMPAIRRDISIAVPAEYEAEELGDRVRDALGGEADAVEEVAVLSRTAYDELPEAAVHRLGMSPEQCNLLVKVVLRHLERTLTDDEANVLRDRIYQSLHQGAAHEWAAR